MANNSITLILNKILYLIKYFFNKNILSKKHLQITTYIPKDCILLGVENIKFSKNVSIGFKSLFTAEGGEIIVGANTSFNSGVHINASVCGKIVIGENCLIGPNVVMRTADHVFERIDIPIRKQGHKCANIFLDDDVWIGANVIILGGVTIGKGVVVGAGSVVTKNIPEYSVVVGAPAKIIKSRMLNK